MALSATDPSVGLAECVCSCSASSAEVYRSFTDAMLGASRISPFCASHGFRGHFHASAKVGRERAQCALSGHMLTLAWLEGEALRFWPRRAQKSSTRRTTSMDRKGLNRAFPAIAPPLPSPAHHMCAQVLVAALLEMAQKMFPKVFVDTTARGRCF